MQKYNKFIFCIFSEVNRRDFRAWYGLGQAYEILKMPFYSLHYYKAAQQLRPYDSRMLVALGETYEKIEKYSNALKCYQKAYNVGDIEGVALLKLAKLHERQGDVEKAIPAYMKFCEDEMAVVDKTSLSHAYLTLSTYFEKTAQYQQAQHYAYKCLDHEETKKEAEGLLKSIANKRAKPTTSARPPSGDVQLADFEEVEMDESANQLAKIIDMEMTQEEILIDEEIGELYPIVEEDSGNGITIDRSMSIIMEEDQNE